jgi:hypothetical protein
MLSSTNNREDYDGDASTRDWPITFPVTGIEDDEITVYYVEADGTENLLSANYDVDLTVPQVTYPTVVSGLPVLTTAESIVILRQLDLTQEIDYKNQGTLPAETIETGLDRLTMMIQQLDEEVARCVQVSVSESTTPDELLAMLDQAVLDAQAAQTAAETAEANAEIAETAAELAQSNAEDAETNAAASAAAAAASAASGLYDDVVAKVFADSPIVPLLANEGTLFKIDTSGGNVVVNLSALSVYGEDMKFAFVKTTSDANTITINRGGTDTINGATSFTITSQYTTYVIVGDSATGLWTNSAQSSTMLRYIYVRLIAAATDVAVDTTIGGDVESPVTGTISEVGAWVDTAGTTGTMVIDINKNGTTIMTTNKVSIDTTEKSSRTAATAAALTTTAISAGDIFTFDIDAVHTTAAKGLTMRIGILA